MLRHRGNGGKTYIVAVLVGGAALGLGALFGAVVMWVLQLSVGAADTLGLFALGAGCLAAGVTAGKLGRQGGLIRGAVSAVLLLVPVCVITAISGGFTGEVFLGRLVVAILCGAAGGVIGVNGKRRI